jgi:Tfp pilus assembly protein PilF
MSSEVNISDKLKTNEYEIEKHIKIAIKYVNVGDYDEGMNSIKKVLNLNKNHSKAQYIMGFIFEFYKGDFKKAAKWYTASHVNGYNKAETSLYRVIMKGSSSENPVISYNKKDD